MWVLQLIPVWFVLALTIPAALAIGGAWRAAKGRRTVICPETNQPVLIELNAPHAALMHAVGNRPRRIQVCERWPERQVCGRQCLARM
jgi:hypothetical protein